MGLTYHKNDLHQLEVNQILDSLIKSYLEKYPDQHCYPALIFQQGQRTIVQLNVSAVDLVNLLQVKPITANNPDSGKDRPEIKGHVDDIKQYIIENASKQKTWFLGTLTANIPPEAITIIELSQSFGLIIISLETKFDLSDGQHRYKAIKEILQTFDAQLIINDYFPITLILEGKFSQCQKDFHDLAQAKPVEKSLLLSFGESSGRNGITKKLIETVLIFRGKTDNIKKSPNKKSKLIYTTNYIATLISCAFTDNRNDELDNFNVEESSQALSKCLNQFFCECLQTEKFSKTNVEKLTIEEVIIFKQECLLGISIGIEILGRLLYCIYDKSSNSFDTHKVSQLALIDWSRDNELWLDNAVRIDSKNENSAKNYIVFGASAVSDAVKIIKLKLGW